MSRSKTAEYKLVWVVVEPATPDTEQELVGAFSSALDAEKCRDKPIWHTRVVVPVKLYDSYEAWLED